MSFTIYLSTQWHQVQELSTITVTKDAQKVINDASDFKQKLQTLSISKYYNPSKLIQVVKKLHARSLGMSSIPL